VHCATYFLCGAQTCLNSDICVVFFTSPNTQMHTTCHHAARTLLRTARVCFGACACCASLNNLLLTFVALFFFFLVVRTCFCRVVFVASRPRALLVSSRSNRERRLRILPWAHLALSLVRFARFFFCFSLVPACTKNSPCLMGLCYARRHSPSPVCPLALRPLRPVSHVFSAPFQCGL